jgi:hypothetical protein
MTTSRQLTANRANARASTGPQSEAGKRRSARNATQLRLSLPVNADPTLCREVTNLARLIAGPGASAKMVGLALPIAEAQVDLARVRRARYAILSGAPGDPDYQSLRAVRVGVSLADRPDGNSQPQSDRAETFAALLSMAVEQLTALDRYERRALSRRKFAIRRLDAARRLTALAVETKG